MKTMKTTLRFTALVFAVLLCLTTLSCTSQMHMTGGNAWDVGIRSGVVSHYYGYSGVH
jgi:hypothetical protein